LSGQTCVDQATFMEKMLDLENLKGRVRTLLAIRHAEGRGEGYRPEAVLPLDALHLLFPGLYPEAAAPE